MHTSHSVDHQYTRISVTDPEFTKKFKLPYVGSDIQYSQYFELAIPLRPQSESTLLGPLCWPPNRVVKFVSVVAGGNRGPCYKFIRNAPIINQCMRAWIMDKYAPSTNCMVNRKNTPIAYASHLDPVFDLAASSTPRQMVGGATQT